MRRGAGMFVVARNGSSSIRIEIVHELCHAKECAKYEETKRIEEK